MNTILQTAWFILAFINAYQGNMTNFLLCLALSTLFGLTQEIKDHVDKKFEEFL